MAPCLSKFPSVCLEAVFKYVPLYDLFYSVGLVCTSWYKSRRTALMRRRRLGLIQCKDHDHKTLNGYRASDCLYGTELIERVRRDDGSPWHTLESLEKYKFNCLSVPGNIRRDVHGIPFIASLSDNFTKITCLHLNITRRTSVLTQLIRLIEHNSQHLVELKFDGDFYPEGRDEDATRELALNMTNLIDCINRLQSLRHLNLSLSDLRFRPPPLSCLARLVTFSVDVDGDFTDDWIFASIERYGHNVTSIKIGNNIRGMLQFNAQLANKFKVLSVNLDDFDDDDDDDDDFDGDHQDFGRMQAMDLFCTRFSSLTRLVIRSSFRSPPMTKLARYLTLLTQLVHLDLHFIYIPPVEAVQPEEAEVEGEAEGEEQDQREQVQLQITQVPSVRLLSLEYYTNSHRDSERLFIPEIFPNVQVLRLEHKFAVCPVCEIGCDDYPWADGFDPNRLEETHPELARRVAVCKRLARQPFRGCANLHTVALNNFGQETLISLDDM